MIKRLLGILIFLSIHIYAAMSQDHITRVIYSGPLDNQGKVWELLGKGVSGFDVDVTFRYDELVLSLSSTEKVIPQGISFIDSCLYPLYSHSKKISQTATKNEILLIVNFETEKEKAYSQFKKIIVPFLDQIILAGPNSEKANIRLLSRDKDFVLATKNDQSKSYIGLIGTKNDLGSTLDSSEMPLLEVDFTELTSWHGAGNIPFPDYMKIKQLVSQAHQHERKVCISNCPNHQSARDVLISSKVDFILTNSPESFQSQGSKQ